jgi:small-conductance mechanosensitive channel
MPPLNALELTYIAIVVGAGFYCLLRTLLFLRGARHARMRSVERRSRFEAIRTETPLEDPRSVALERGRESIESHFSVLKRLLVPLIVGLTLLLAAVPLLAGTSAATASMIGAVIAVVLGVALRPFLENAVAGLVISSSRLVRIGDTVRIDDWYGTVEDITATHTTVKVWDWRRYLVPNGRMLQKAFFNYSVFDSYQWAYVEFWVAPDADIDLVQEIAVAAPARSRHFSGGRTPSSG